MSHQSCLAGAWTHCGFRKRGGAPLARSGAEPANQWLGSDKQLPPMVYGRGETASRLDRLLTSGPAELADTYLPGPHAAFVVSAHHHLNQHIC